MRYYSSIDSPAWEAEESCRR